VDLLELIEQKRFFGEEFLTWLWFHSEVNSGLVELPQYGAVEVWFEDRVALESGTGNTKQKVTCQGKDLELREARTAVREGKKVSAARIRLAAAEREWHLTLKAEGLELSGVRLPKTLDPEDEEAEGVAGRMLERVAVTRDLVQILDALYARFLEHRLTPAWDRDVLPRIKRWLSEGTGG
jgi:recombination associated protein RdgC